jgi:dephospho-CoA kinase
VTATDAKRPLRVGLTGGIASGKSTVADIFAELGVPVIDTDVIAREVVQPGEPAINEIRERFGDAVIDTKDHLDRAAMRKIIFADETARLDLEAILHPRIGEQVRRQADAACGPYQLIVVPLLIGSPIREYVDRILVVDCDEKTQIQRLLKRDSESIEQAQKILDSQPSRQERLAIADDVIINDQELEQIQSQVIALHQHYQRLAEH